MAEVVLFHHACGLTPGIETFAETPRQAGHIVHVPDLYDGRTFDDLGLGIGYAQEIGFGTVIERGVRAVETLPADLVYIGLSLGVLPTQMLAQTRPGAKGALLIAACVPPSELGAPWPADLPVQVHGMDADEIFVTEGDLDAARDLVASVANAELFLYPGDAHLFFDNSLPSYDPAAAQLLTERVIGFLDSAT